jgi:hypothetical protein
LGTGILKSKGINYVQIPDMSSQVIHAYGAIWKKRDLNDTNKENKYGKRALDYFRQ